MDPEECRAMARECDQLAKHAPETDMRVKLLELAGRWRELAEVTEATEQARRSKLH
jgi:hypothetical protein